ncbi:transcription factor WhiB [Streptomyces sp. TLI_235]|nr:WhiB family transcriptional regulator [Streptomyces sp. TLI_235]PBC76168.1 transcription factor WhiB [Streptomyces sp. TLI_235]
MTRFVRRGLRGTAHPHLTARPTGSLAVEIVPSPDGDLRGAACQGVDPNLFYAEPDVDDPDADPAASEFAVRRAKMVCAGCPVRQMCLALALDRNEPYGIFGGLTADERRTLKREAAKAARKAGAA